MSGEEIAAEGVVVAIDATPLVDHGPAVEHVVALAHLRPPHSTEHPTSAVTVASREELNVLS